MTEEVALVHRRGRDVVEDRHVGGTSLGQFAKSDPELTLREVGVVLQEQLRRLRECDARVAVVETMEQVGGAHLGEHVRVHAVRAESHQDALAEHLQDLRHADRVVHVRFGVVDDAGPCVGDNVHLFLVNVDTMHEDGFLARDVQPMQTLHGRDAVLFERILAVGRVLRDVDVAADARVSRDADALLNRVVRDGERGVQSHHGRDLAVAFADLFDEAFVLSNALPVDVAVRDLVAQRGADSRLPHRGLDDVERAVAGGGGGVMVNDGRRPVADALDQRDLRREQDVVADDGAVHFPPQAFEDFHEVGGGFARDRHAARQRGIKMMVRADEAWQNDFVRAVHRLGVGIFLFHLRGCADGDDILAVRHDRAVPEHAVIFAEGDYDPVFKSSGHVSFLFECDERRGAFCDIY
ncbi:MAG: hypothetical protein PGMFKBFP_01607 [Anaerolineales bacterium]|nr:hypothetical protein [Anaerolineales bacterium]